jgi:hypothetical protein
MCKMVYRVSVRMLDYNGIISAIWKYKTVLAESEEAVRQYYENKAMIQSIYIIKDMKELNRYGIDVVIPGKKIIDFLTIETSE